MNFPSIFAIRRYRPEIDTVYSELKPYKNIVALIKAERNNEKWNLRILDNPRSIIRESLIIESNEDMWFKNDIVTIYVDTNHNLNSITTKYNNYHIYTESMTIPLLKISDPCLLLGEKFYNLKEYPDLYFQIEKGQEIKKPLIPSHILNIYTKHVIDNKELCPITMEPLTKETIMITECGHAMSSSAMKWINEKKSCPVCRVSI
jgi:hypothetical protein